MKKLVFRRLDFKDLPTRVEWFNNADTYRMLTLDVPISLSETEQWFRQNLLNRNRIDIMVDLHEKTKNNQETIIPASMEGLVDISNRHNHADLYVLVNPELRGLSIGKYAFQWLINYGFTKLQLNRILFCTHDYNERAQRFYEKNGFVHEGLLRQHLYIMDHYVDRHYYGLVKSDWEKLPWKLTKPISFEIEI